MSDLSDGVWQIEDCPDGVWNFASWDLLDDVGQIGGASNSLDGVENFALASNFPDTVERISQPK